MNCIVAICGPILGSTFIMAQAKFREDLLRFSTLFESWDCEPRAATWRVETRWSTFAGVVLRTHFISCSFRALLWVFEVFLRLRRLEFWSNHLRSCYVGASFSRQQHLPGTGLSGLSVWMALLGLVRHFLTSPDSDLAANLARAARLRFESWARPQSLSPLRVCRGSWRACLSRTNMSDEWFWVTKLTKPWHVELVSLKGSSSTYDFDQCIDIATPGGCCEVAHAKFSRAGRWQFTSLCSSQLPSVPR